MSLVIPLTRSMSYSVFLSLRYCSTGIILGSYPFTSRTPAMVLGPVPITSLVVFLMPFPEARASTIKGFTVHILVGVVINVPGNNYRKIAEL